MGTGAAEGERLEFTSERTLAAPPWLVWAVAGDSNRWNRVLGAGLTDYTRELTPDGGYQQVGHSQMAGAPASWIERGEWLEGQYMQGERRYLSGPLALGGFRIEVARDADDANDATRIRLYAYTRPAQPLPERFTAKILHTLEHAAIEYLDALESVFRDATLPAREPDEPATTYGRRAMQALALGKVLGGGRAPLSEHDLDFAIGKLRDTSVDDDHCERIIDLVKTRPDYELEQIRPFELAKAWGSGRRPLLRSFLHAASAGLFDLRWQLNCPRCRVGASSAPRLSQVAQRSHCDVCDIDFAIDFAANVEAVFRVNPAIRAVEDRRYCTSSPWFRPHVFAVVEVAGGETRRVRSPQATLGFLARSLRGRDVLQTEPGQRSLILDAAGLRAEQASTAEGDEIVIRNDTESACTVLFERREANAYATRGTDILTLPEFIDLYGAEAPASGADLSISSVTVLFSDLAKSTELYRSLGDARAFALVHAHFEEMRAIIAEHDGATLKTMGDAVMASFASPGDAAGAAMRMIEATRAHTAQELGLKVGIHQGACVMVRSNGRLDLFGTTVNTAWRLQEQADRDQIAITESLLGHSGVTDLLRAHNLPVESIVAELRGVHERYAFARITIPR